MTISLTVCVCVCVCVILVATAMSISETVCSIATSSLLILFQTLYHHAVYICFAEYPAA